MQSARTVPRARVLVVDDEPAVGAALRRLLLDHEVTVVDSGASALVALRDQSFDVILCDVLMPRMTGMELYAELEDRMPDQAARIVFVTGGAFTAAARAFLDRVPNARLDKPVDPKVLSQIVTEAARRGR